MIYKTFNYLYSFRSWPISWVWISSTFLSILYKLFAEASYERNWCKPFYNLLRLFMILSYVITIWITLKAEIIIESCIYKYEEQSSFLKICQQLYILCKGAAQVTIPPMHTKQYTTVYGSLVSNDGFTGCILSVTDSPS